MDVDACLRHVVGLVFTCAASLAGELTNRLVEDTRLLKMVATSAISMALRSATVTALGLAMM